MLWTLHYPIAAVKPYINWLYFYHAWGVTHQNKQALEDLRKDAEQMLNEMDGHYKTHARFGLFDANSQGDDILVYTDETMVRLPMLRQQRPAKEGEPQLCLADFIRPIPHTVETDIHVDSQQSQKDRIGLFATTVDHSMENDFTNEPYQQMLAQTLADRLAEATAERMHFEVRTNYWGYVPDEQLSINDLHAERFIGIRPAIGYPSLPETSLNFLLDKLLDFKAIGIRLTESGMMKPHASVSGMMLAHPKAHYFDVGRIGDDQLRDYALRRNIPYEMARRFLSTNFRP